MFVDPTTITVGTEVPPFSREGTLLHWARYAAVNPAHIVPHHLDDAAAQQEGFETAFIMAPLEHGYLHAMLEDWMGPTGRVRSLDIRLRRPLLRGRTITASGTVTAVREEDGELVVELAVQETDDLGEVLAPGTAVVSFPL